MVLVVGGHTRNIGKTSVVCGIIRGLPEWNWTAIKITQYGHGVCSKDGEACECSDPVHPIAISRETGASPSTDSGRFLAAGAVRSYWVRTPSGELNAAMPSVRRVIADSENTIIESNSILRFLKPDVCVMVLDGAVEDFKRSSLRFLDRANLLVVTSEAPLVWANVPAAILQNKPKFFAPAPLYENAALTEEIRVRGAAVHSGSEIIFSAKS